MESYAAMDEEFSLDDPTQLLDSASDFAHYPGVQNDVATKEFLHRFPLPVIISALQTKADVPGLETTLVACLERVFKTKHGASLIPQYMSFVQVGLKADSQIVRGLACKTVSSFLENFDDKSISAIQLIVDYDIYPLLLDCLISGNEQVATASIDAIKNLAQIPEGMGIIFPANNNEATHLGNLASRCSSLGRSRVLSLIVKLFSISSSVASVIYNSNLLSLLEAEIRNSNDTLATLSALELLYELTEVQHGTEFLSRTTLQLLHSIISNSSMEAILRSRAMMVAGRLLSKENVYTFIDEPSAKGVISAIDVRLGLLDSQDVDECESALEALGQIGSSIQGAVLLLSSFPPAARHIIYAAFDLQGRGKQLAALHALANVAGENRPDDSVILNSDAEENLRRLIYEAASESSKFTPSGLFLSVLRQAAEFRMAGYRVITGLVARSWCLMEICSKEDIVNIVIDPATETTKIGMEARYNCCKAIHKAFFSSKLVSEPALSGIAGKLQEAIQRGPYLAKKHAEAVPVVMTAERF
ncbi:Armadillo-like helical [Corchorus olitorius]|uniref:Armadillo-like helical n=1 Tax=Corchorus olitorius TaxID=93759 RepID=A0A1R3G641_9ROSI|nr:Armadillo-like helical [Corchorus olitorius]